MKERPILFSGELVRAILEGRKTVTRRPVKLPAHDVNAINWLPDGDMDDATPGWFAEDVSGSQCEPAEVWSSTRIRCPYGVPGDRLWVRETFSLSARTVYPCPPCWYRADFTDYDDPARGEHVRGCKGNADCFGCEAERSGKFHWKPSIFLPRHLSRITLDVVSVDVQRLQDITEDDAVREGMTGSETQTPREQFAAKWNEIYGAGEWARNPFCWRIEFKRVER